MHHVNLPEQAADFAQSGERWRELLRVPALSVGVYALPAGADDAQQPHTEDEVYYVVRGHGAIVVGAEQRPVRPGDLIYVAACAEHRFVEITEDLEVLVFFAPAEYSRS